MYSEDSDVEGSLNTNCKLARNSTGRNGWHSAKKTLKVYNGDIYVVSLS